MQDLQKQSEEILCLKDQAEVKFKLCIALINEKLRSNPYFLPCITDSTCRPANNEVTKMAKLSLTQSCWGVGGGAGTPLYCLYGDVPPYTVWFFTSLCQTKSLKVVLQKVV